MSTVYCYGGARFAGKGLALGLGLRTAPLGLGVPTLGGLGLGLGAGYGAPLALAGGYARQAIGPVTAAVHSTRSYEVVPVPVSYEAAIPQTIDIPLNVQPINMIFRTQSSPLNVQQIHTPAAPTYQSSRSEDAPSVLTHESYKPVIQEYREVIQPFRKIEQRIEPVIEHVHTVVAKGEQYAAPVALAAPVARLAPLAAPVRAFAAPLALTKGY